MRLFAAFLFPLALLAQSGESSITGSVTDATGSAVPGIRIALTNQETGTRTESETNPSGVYRFGGLVPASYRIEANGDGFEPSVRSGIALTVSQTLAVDLILKVAGSVETVTVEGTVPLADTQSSSAGQLVSRQMVAGLPLPNRAATSLAALAPGVVMIDTGQGAENYPVFSVAGGRARNQHFTLDGGNVSNAVGLTRPQQMTSLPMDAMQEFRVISNNYSAEYGHSTGGIITLSTRSGTNSYHASLFEFLRNSALDGRNFFAAQRPPLRLNQFGGSIGGPIRKDQTHFFLTWEQTRQVSSTILVQTVPTLAQRHGDFSGLAPIYDPATTVGRDRRQFPGNAIPLSRFDPVSKAVLNYWPLPNRGGSSYAVNSNSDLHRDIVVAKLDHQIRMQDHLTARYYINDSTVANLGSYPLAAAAPDAFTDYARIQSFLAGHTHLFRPTILNDLKVSFLQRTFLEQRFGAGEDLAGSVGLTGVSAAAFPTFNVPGYAGLGGQVSRAQTPIRDLQVLEAVSWYKGRHAIKLGYEYRRGSNTEIRDRASSGAFGFTPLITGKPGVAGTGDAFASFLLGELNSASVAVSDKIPSHAYYQAGYIQDDWRITDRLTLTAGLRWEVELPRRVDGDLQNSFDPLTGTVTFSGRNGVPRNAFNTDWNNFGPRAGFAWRSPVASIVVRGGGGVFYGPTVSNTIGDAATTGFSTAASFVTSQADLTSVFHLRDGLPSIAHGAIDSRTAVGFFERDRPTPISYQYNLSLQREVRDAVIELGYMGNVSHHLTANDLTINQVEPSRMGPGNSTALRPYPQFSDVYIINPAIGNSTYHAGFIKAEKRFSRSIAFLAHYTYSKFIDDVASSNEYGDPQSYMDAYNRRLDKGLSGSDVPQRLVLTALYEVPAIRGSRLANAIAGGWRAGAFGTLQSGAPFTVVTTSNTTNAFPAGPLRPNLIADPLVANPTVDRYFNMAAFEQPRAFTFGNSPRSVLRGPQQQSVDATLSKEFVAREKYRTELRGEFYNVLNHANFDPPAHTFGAADFGRLVSARAARSVQLGLRLSF